jgi:hypothetical protein
VAEQVGEAADYNEPRVLNVNTLEVLSKSEEYVGRKNDINK